MQGWASPVALCRWEVQPLLGDVQLLLSRRQGILQVLSSAVLGLLRWGRSLAAGATWDEDKLVSKIKVPGFQALCS